MKLAYVIRSAHAGGVERHVIGLIEAFRHRHDIRLITLTDDPPDKVFLELGVPIHQLEDRPQQSLKAFGNVLRLKRLLRSEAPDAVHLHGIRPIFVGAVAARLAGVPTVISTFHSSVALMSLDIRGRSSAAKLLVSRLMHASGVMLSTQSIAVSQHIRAELLGLLGPVPFLPALPGGKRISVIRNGIELERFSKALKPARAATEPAIIGYIGRLDPKKGVEDLVTAFTKLRASGLNAELQIVGDGWDEERLRALATRLGVLESIRFWGHQDDVVPIAQRFDVFVLPSLSEGMPLTIIEMMALGVPVIATRVGGIPEQISDGESGLLVDARNPEQIAQQLRKVLEQPQLGVRIAAAARERALALFDAGSMLRSLEAIYSG